MPSQHEAILARIDTAWASLLAAIDGLDDDALTTPGVTGDWSVKDILGQITTWEDSTMTRSQATIDGTPQPGSDSDEPWDLDTFNARTSAAKADLAPDVVLSQLAETHARLLEWIATIPAEHLAEGAEVEGRLREDTWGHYPEHTAAITAWRAIRE
jgi:hypothetical protein